jgi:alkylated DNA repair dioxygenase AlkB
MESQSALDDQIKQAAAGFDVAALQQRYHEQSEFLVLEGLLPADLLATWQSELEQLKPAIHRNYIPRHKKGGSVSYDQVHARAPHISGVYHSAALLDLLRRLTGAAMQPCPATDPHRCALYAYTEEGDHIGWHYDTSYYKDRRWTLLVGLEDHSSSRLLCHLHTRARDRAVQKLELRVAPGTAVLFNGDTVYHCVTPTRAGEWRFIVSMQFVTNAHMNPLLRFVSHMKDAIAYFGLKEVFLGKRAGAKADRDATARLPA